MDFIKIKQVKSLNALGTTRLKEWWKPKIGDAVYFNGFVRFIEDIADGADKETENEKVKTGIPLLNMRQMIEYLGYDYFGNPTNDKQLQYVDDGDFLEILWLMTKEKLESKTGIK